MSATDTISCKNTDRAQRPVDVTGGRCLAPGEIGDVPDDDHTADLLKTGRLTRVQQHPDDQVPTGTADAVEKWVGTDKDRAQQALETEKASSRPRSTLIDALTKIIDSEEH